MSDRAFRYIEKRSSSHYTNESKPEQCLVLFSDSLSGLLFMRVVDTASLPPHSLLRTPSHDHQVLRNFRHFLFQNHMSHIQSNPTCPHPHGHRIPIVCAVGFFTISPTTKDPYFVCISQNKTTSKMYAFMFLSVATSKSNCQAKILIFLMPPPTKEMVSKGRWVNKEGNLVFELFLDRELFMSC